MKTQMYADRNPNIIRYRERCLELHKKKVMGARAEKKQKVQAQTMDELEKRNLAKQRTHGHALLEKEAEIRRCNQKLLDKLIEISSGKFGILPRIDDKSMPKSLNYNKRKKDILKIEQENLAFARRLIEKKGQINVQKMNSDYERHCQLRDRIKRVSSGVGKKSRSSIKKSDGRSKTPNTRQLGLPLQPIKEQPKKEEKKEIA